MSKLFIDTANLTEIGEVLKRGIIDGVTTNPSLIGKEKRQEGDITEAYVNHMRKIVSAFDGHMSEAHLSVEVFTLEPIEIVSQAKDLVKRINYDRLAIKVPISYKGRDYLEVVRELSGSEIKVNCTCCAGEGQLELAAKAGAKYVSLFFNRLIDFNVKTLKSQGAEENIDESIHERARGMALQTLRNTRAYLDSSGIEAEIILGSIRHGYDVTDGWNAGAHIVTAGYKPIQELFAHPVTESSVKGFDEDFQKWART
jgi:transaldolase